MLLVSPWRGARDTMANTSSISTCSMYSSRRRPGQKRREISSKLTFYCAAFTTPFPAPSTLLDSPSPSLLGSHRAIHLSRTTVLFESGAHLGNQRVSGTGEAKPTALCPTTHPRLQSSSTMQPSTIFFSASPPFSHTSQSSHLIHQMGIMSCRNNEQTARAHGGAEPEYVA